MKRTGLILAGTALLALAACGRGAAPANNSAVVVSNDVYLPPDDLGGNDVLLNDTGLNAASNAAATNSVSNSASGNRL